MSDSDTVKLLRECNSGIQMAVFSIDEILEKVTDKNLYEILKKSKERHENSATKPTQSLQNVGMNKGAKHAGKRHVMDENQRQSHDG